ncbi:YceD family protein [Victivallis vadensis]|uniref:YceD family protein n=1 Tax=Victivallis vadensis TaxID=172901 RepID=UPI0025962414|nr:YceD family protein [Victivallis vadensis]
MIKFSVARLEKEPIELTGSEPAEFLEIEPGELLAVSAPVEYDLNLKAVSGGALVEGQVSTELSGICGRCLEPVTRHVKNDSICLFLELGDQDEMDISEEIRAEMLLELPMTLLCSDDCAGLCPVCGCNLNKTSCNCAEPPSGPSCWDALDNLQL